MWTFMSVSLESHRGMRWTHKLGENCNCTASVVLRKLLSVDLGEVGLLVLGSYKVKICNMSDTDEKGSWLWRLLREWFLQYCQAWVVLFAFVADIWYEPVHVQVDEVGGMGGLVVVDDRRGFGVISEESTTLTLAWLEGVAERRQCRVFRRRIVRMRVWMKCGEGVAGTSGVRRSGG
ncbi:hypothetical protein Tco_0596173 [Tanacetum coccineum]